MVAGAPSTPIEPPSAIARLAGDRPLTAIWLNEAGGVTFEIGVAAEPDRRFVKWAPAHSGLDLPAEAERLRWAARYVVVPSVVGAGLDRDGTWLVTTALAGESAVSERWKREPERAVRALGAGLRRFHDALPIRACPFTWSVDERRRRAGWAAEVQAPPIDRLVVCHGDACSPNTILTDDGRLSGHVDLGSLGVADRWADLAVATLATRWNYGSGYEQLLLDAYEIAPDPFRVAFYRRLWDAS